MRSRYLVVAALPFLLAGAGPALAAWTPPERASVDPGEAHAPDVAVNARGAAVAAWVRTLPGGVPEIVATVRRRAAGSWEPVAVVSPPGRAAADPTVAISRAGVAVVGWRQVVRDRVLTVGGRPRTQVVYVAFARERRVAGPWGAVAALSSDQQKVGPPEIAIDGHGVAVATWHWGTGTAPGSPGFVGRVQLAERVPGQAWTAPRSVSHATECRKGTGLPSVAVGTGGQAVVSWECRLVGGRTTAYAVARGDVPGRWSRERRLPFDTRGPQTSDLAVNDGGVVVGLSGSRSAGSAMRLNWWRASAAAPALDLALLPAPRASSTASFTGILPALGLAGASAGSTVAVWASGGRLVTADLGDTVGPRRSLSPASAGVRAIRVATAGGPAAVALALSGTREVLAAVRDANGAWGPAAPISGAGGVSAVPPPVAGVAASGDAVAYWTRVVAGVTVVERAAFGAG